MIDNKLSAVIAYKLPEFVRDEHEMFVAFIKAYIEFLEEDGNYLHYLQRYQRNLDVDLADDDFIAEYVKEFAGTFPKNALIPTNQLLKLMREFYLSKGSEDSFRFIFTVLYGTDIDIIYPREQMYIPSSGEYSSTDITYITGNNWFKFNVDADNLNATLEGVVSGAGAVIDSVTANYINGQMVLRLELSSFTGQFEVGEDVILTVDDVDVIETIYGSVSMVDVVDGGTNYQLTDKLIFTDSTGRRAKANISKLAIGGLTEATIISGGSDYEVGDVIKAVATSGSNGYGFRATVYEVDAFGAITRVRVDAPGYDYNKNTIGSITSLNGSGASISLNGENIGKIESIEVIDGGINYTNPSINIDTSTGSGANLSPIVGGVFTEPKRYRNLKSTPSGTSKIMDSYYYQQFSYVISSNISPNRWLGKVKRIAHPAGTQLFGMYRLHSEFEILVDVAPSLTSSITRSLAYLFEFDLDQPLTTELQRNIMRHDSVVCPIGLTFGDLDEIKFYPTFDWTISEFADLSIQDIEADCPSIMDQQESSEIIIT